MKIQELCDVKTENLRKIMKLGLTRDNTFECLLEAGNISSLE
jgi:hypothetical protein